MKEVKKSYALCNSRMEPVMHFNGKAQLDSWIARQAELHGSVPNCTTCLITTTIETEEIK